MEPITIITCFSYPDTKKFIFNPIHLRSDLRRILAFAHNKAGSSFQDIYVLTDIRPNQRVCDKMIQEFQEQVRICLRKRGLGPPRTQIHRKRPIDWLHHVAEEKVARDILTEISPVIHLSTSVEFASLFTNFSLICGREDYDNSLTTIFQRPMTNLFFYYSGHGIKTIDCRGYDLGLVIPGESGKTELYPRARIQKCFRESLSEVHLIVIFDCCYGENFLELPFRMGFKPGETLVQSGGGKREGREVICLSGTRADQTCGFYSDPRDSSSLYTYYLLRCFNNISQEIKSGLDNRELSRLYHEVELKVQEYRLRTGKAPQNMLIGLSDPSIDQFPKWLFRNAFTGQKEWLIEGG